MWRILLALTVLSGLPAMARAACADLGDARPLIKAGTIKPLTRMLAPASRAAAGGEMIDGKLCETGGNYHYVVTFLRPDGKVVRVTINARTGAIAGVR